MDQSTDKGEPGSSSTRPYLIRALHEWCTDNGFTPYIAVHVDRLVQVPMEYVSNNEIVLNVGFDATSGLELGNDFVQFKARFGGTAREIIVPVDHVVAIYARENGQGMAFPAPEPAESAPAAPEAAAADVSAAPRGLRLAAVPSGGASDADPSGSAAAVPAAASSPQSAPILAAVPSADSRTQATAEEARAVEAQTVPSAEASDGADGGDEPEGPGPTSGGGRPTLTRIK